MVVSCINFRKKRMQRKFLECGNRDDLQNLMKTAGQGIFALGDRDEQVGAQRRPDLDANSIGRGAEKSAQAQVLLDPTEEQLDRPAAAVNLRDDQRFEVESVGQENEGLAGFRIDIADSPQGRWGQSLNDVTPLKWLVSDVLVHRAVMAG